MSGLSAAGAALSAVAVLGLTPGASAISPEGYGGRFSASTSGDGVRLTVDFANSLSRNPIDGGGPTAQAVLDSLGTSKAFASYPYPGELPLSLPPVGYGVLLSFFPQLSDVPPPPPYPFYVASDASGDTHGDAIGPAQSLEADSSPTASASKASGGFGGPSGSGGLAEATSSITSAVEGVVAGSRSHVAGFAAGPIALGEVTSTARVALSSDGRLERLGEITISGLTIAGVPVGITDQGLTQPGGNVPLPSSDPINQALEQAGISISLVPKGETANGVIAPSVRIVQQFPDQSGSVTYLIGSAASAVDGTASSSTAPAGGAAGGAVPADTGLPTTGVDAVGLVGSPQNGAGLAGAVPAGVSTVDGVTDAGAATRVAQVRGQETFSVSGLCLVLAFAGLFGLALPLLARLLPFGRPRPTT